MIERVEQLGLPLDGGAGAETGERAADAAAGPCEAPVEAGGGGTAGAPLPPTPEQAAAIDARDRDVFLEAGAGTGKTRVLVSRYCDAIDRDGIGSERILAFTFTERAAAEMRRRVRVELARRAAGAAADSDPERRGRLLAAARAGESAPVTTIHGYCRRLLAAHPVAAGLDPRFRVLDAEEAARLAAVAYDEALAALAPSDADVVAAAASYRWRLAGIVRAAHAELRNRGLRRPELPPIQFTALEGKGAEPASAAGLEWASAAYGAIGRLLVAYGDRYEALCAERSGVDFDHLQLIALELLRGSAAIASAQRERFDHLLVDEFQDTSPLQVELVRALCGPATRLFAVGDEFQSIYAFRGADLACFRRERERIEARAAANPDAAAVLPLTGSFRSDPDVVAAVNAVGAALLDDFRELRVGRAPRGPAGEPVVELLLTARDGWDEPGHGIATARPDAPASRVAEARHLAARLRELADAGVARSGMVVLLRAFTHVDVYTEALELAGLEPHVAGGRGYWSNQQVGDGLRLLACVANPLDDEPLLGALASPACGAGPDALWILRRIAGPGAHLWPTLELLFGPDRDEDDGEGGADPDEFALARAQRRSEWEPRFAAADRERLGRFRARLCGLREVAATLPLDTLVERTLETFDYDLATLLMDDGRRRTANLRKLVRIATEYEAHDGRDLRGFLDHAAARAAASDRENEAGAASEEHAGVRLMTIHAAKGLEFETVAVADLGRKLCAGGQPPELRLAFAPEQDEEPEPARVGLRLARAAAAAIDTEGYGALGEEAGDAEAEESGRLVYVAASRAERRLLLSGVFTDADLEASERPRRNRTALGCLLPALGVKGSDGELLTLPAPSPRPGLDEAGPFAAATAVVRVNRAGAEAAQRLGRDRRTAATGTVGADASGAPLVALGDAGAAAARSLSYVALADYGRCGYRFLTERVLGLGADRAATAADAGANGDDAGARRDWDEAPVAAGGGAAAAAGRGAGGDGAAGGVPAQQARLGFGRAVHELLEWSARNGWEMPDAAMRAAVLAREGAGADAEARLAAMLAGWLGSALLAELRAAGGGFRPEAGFRLALGAGTTVRGTIDLLWTPDRAGELTVIDYKTDRLDGRPPALDDGYLIQRALYACAAAAATGAGSVRSAYVFLERPDEPVVAVLDSDEIAAGRARVEAVIARIGDADFAATAHPHRDLCHDCPARPRLCPHGRELTGRASPEPPVQPQAASRVAATAGPGVVSG